MSTEEISPDTERRLLDDANTQPAEEPASQTAEQSEETTSQTVEQLEVLAHQSPDRPATQEDLGCEEMDVDRSPHRP